MANTAQPPLKIVPGSRGKKRLLLLLSIVGYVAFFQWMYVNYLYPFWGYFGFDYNPPGRGYIVLAWFLSVIPSLWMPADLSRPSQLAYWVLYVAVTIPSMFVPLYVGLNPPNEIVYLLLALFAGLAIAGSSYLLPLFQIRPPRVSPRLFWLSVGCLTAGLSLWMIIVFRHHLQIVSFQDVYEVRNAANDVGEGTQVDYAFTLLTGAMYPFLMGWGLYRKHRWVFLTGALGQVLVYSIEGTKGSVSSILFVLVFYFLLRAGRKGFALKMAWAALAFVAVLCFSLVLAGYDPGPLHTTLLFVVLMRTLSVNGLLTAQYYKFFQHNPLTYFSHIKGVNWILAYPYKYAIGQEIGLAYVGSTNLDATAHFWATDGIGGLGLPGVLLMSFLCAGVFWILDSASQKHDPRLAALVTTYAAFELANISLFTSLCSGGLALMILLLYLMPLEAPAVAVASMRKRNHKLYPMAATPPAALRGEGV